MHHRPATVSSTGLVPENSASLADDIIIVQVAGEIDLHTAPAFRQAIELAVTSATRVIVDLSETSFMDSTGLAALCAANHRSDRNADPLTLRNPNAMILKVLACTGLDQVLAIERHPHRGTA